MEIINIKKVKQVNKYLNKVAGLMCELWTDTDLEGYVINLKKALKNEYTILIAMDGENAVGYIELCKMYSYDEKYSPVPLINICGLFITYAMRRRGIATKLMNAAEDYGKEIGCAKISSNYYDFNKSSENLHKKNGYQVTSRIINVIKEL